MPTSKPRPAAPPLLDAAPSDPSAAPSDPSAATPPPADGAFKLLWSLWRAKADRDAPTLLQLQDGRVRRVDADPVSGYVAVVTADDTHRALGVERAFLAALVAALTGRTEAEVAALLARGPVRLEPAAPTDAAPPA